MTDFSWTLGPWEIQGYDYEGHANIGSVSRPVDGCPVHIATVSGIDSFNWPGIGTHEANAELVSLAPEMAEALLAYNDMQCSVDEYRPGLECCEKHDAASKTLDKVTEKLRAITNTEASR